MCVLVVVAVVVAVVLVVVRIGISCFQTSDLTSWSRHLNHKGIRSEDVAEKGKGISVPSLTHTLAHACLLAKG